MNRRIFISYAFCACSAFALNVSSKIKSWHLGSYGEFYFKRMNKNVFVMHGVRENPNAENMGFIHNVGLIESKNGLIVIDPGAYNIGDNVVQQIKKISSKPVIAIFNTHDHDDHWFANSIVKNAYPKAKIYAHKLMKSAAQELYGGRYVKRGFTFDKAKRIDFADVLLDEGDKLTIDFENFYIQHPIKGHTNNDITIEHLNSSTIFMGDLLFEKTLANFGLNSSIYGNIEFLDKVNKQKEYKLYVPGHGLSGSKEFTFTPYLTFMNIIKDEVQKAYDDGVEFADLGPVEDKIIQRLEWRGDLHFSYKFIERFMQGLYDEIDMKEAFA